MLILPAAPAAAISGKQDDTIVYFRWRGNQAARSYTTPANPQTTNQQNVRNYLATLSAQWSTLSQANRDAWTEFATLNPTTDRFGRSVTPTGLNWYLKANFNRLLAGDTAVSTAPGTSAPSPILTATLTATVSGLAVAASFDWDASVGSYSVKAQIEVPPTAAWTPSLRRSRLISGVSATSLATLDPVTSQSVNWNSEVSFVAGSTVYVWLTIVNDINGLESLPLLVQDIAA